MYKSELSDHELWEAIALDDARAFTAFYDRHWKGIFRTALHYLHDQEVAEQLLQDVFVSLWNRRKTLKIRNFKAYFIVATRYHVFSYLRSVKLNPMVYLENYSESEEQSLINEAEDRSDLNDFKQLLSAHLAELPKRCREIFWLSRVNQLSNDEIAEKLDVSKRTIENQIAIATKHLKKIRNLSVLGIITIISLIAIT
jgi:RNA polymerase sigma-70 factor (ECF subfamily)